MPIGLVDYKLTTSDFVDAFKLARAPTKRTWLLLLTLIALPGVIVWLWRREPLFGLIVAVGGLIGGVLGGLAERFIVTPWRARRIYRQQPLAHRDFHLELLDEGLIITSNRGENHLLWSDIIKWRGNHKVAIAYLSPTTFLILPARLQCPSFSIQALHSALTQKRWAAKEVMLRRKWRCGV